jgi:hypothetical protein
MRLLLIGPECLAADAVRAAEERKGNSPPWSFRLRRGIRLYKRLWACLATGIPMVFRLGSLASFMALSQDVCSSSDSGGGADIPQPPLGASRLMRRGKSRPIGLSMRTSTAHSVNPAFRKPSIISFAVFDSWLRAIHADIVKAGSISSIRAAASRASASRPRWAKADARQRYGPG